MLQLCFLFVMFAFATENDYWVTDGLMEQTNSDMLSHLKSWNLSKCKGIGGSPEPNLKNDY